MQSAEKAYDTTLDDEKYNLRNVRECRVDRTCIVVTALCKKPEAKNSVTTSRVTCKIACCFIVVKWTV